MVPKNAKRFLLALGIALLPGVAGAAGFGGGGGSFWGRLADPMELLGRAWDGLTSLWTGGGSVDPNGGAGTDGGGSVDPNGGGTSGARGSGDGGGSIDPNG
jgi:hypothetical protein